MDRIPDLVRLILPRNIHYPRTHHLNHVPVSADPYAHSSRYSASPADWEEAFSPSDRQMFKNLLAAYDTTDFSAMNPLSLVNCPFSPLLLHRPAALADMKLRYPNKHRMHKAHYLETSAYQPIFKHLGPFLSPSVFPSPPAALM